MLVYELMNLLAEMPAGTGVVVQLDHGTHAVNLETVDDTEIPDGFVRLVGDGTPE